MPRSDYRRCKECHRPVTECGELSHTRLCFDCGRRIEAENAIQIHLDRGPYAERRRYGIAVAEFGPRVALALRQAGVFDSATGDSPEPAT